MEEKWVITTPDHHKIYGVKNCPEKPSRKAIFIVHGLTGHMYEYAFKRAADFFSADFDVYRFNLYDGQDGGRFLENCTVQTHANDLNTVLHHFSAAYDDIFLIGHSYGGPTIMIACPEKVTAVSLWDPSFDLRFIQTEFHKAYVAVGEYYMVKWGVTSLIGKAMYDEANRMDEAACIALSKAFPAPIQVITAADGCFHNKPISYHSYGPESSIREYIEGTVHCFYEGDTCDTLLEKTQAWFSRHLSCK